jgi:hypothetical protein
LLIGFSLDYHIMRNRIEFVNAGASWTGKIGLEPGSVCRNGHAGLNPLKEVL